MSALPVLDAVEQRVLGSLLEKQRTVPETYPLSLNALRTACNQSTSRDPVVSYDDATVLDALNRLRDRELVRFVKPTGLRVVKYHQRLEEHLELDPPGVALIAALLLRGPQSTGELRPRTERMYAFADKDAVEEALHELAARDVPLVQQLARQPGRQDRRWVHLLSAEPVEPEPAPEPVDLDQVLAEGAGPRNRRVSSEYDRLAEAYADALDHELDTKPFDRWLLERLTSDAPTGQGLDVGCGPGQVGAFLASHGRQTTGLDLSPAMIDQARRRHPQITAVQGSFELPPMPSGGDPRDPGWALITAWYAVVHLAGSELATVVARWAGSLRRGGVLALATHVGADIQRPGELFGVSTELEFVLHDADTLLGAFAAAGLTDVEWYLRGPLPAEAQTQRLYVVGRRATEGYA